MAEHPELWTERAPPQRGLFDRTPTFGVAHDAELMEQEGPPAPAVVAPAKLGRKRGPFLTSLRLPWSYGDRRSGELWRRMKCGCRRHEMRGGHTVHLEGTVVFLERRCRWCGAAPS